MSNEPPGMYPAITHFADAIAALPREFRRHNSLLKEADAKAWALEESLQEILQQCLEDTRSTTYEQFVAAQSLTGAGEDPSSEVHSVAGASLDNASLVSVRSADPTSAQSRQQFHNLRQNLMSIMMTMDEKNHVINTANEEVARQIRRMDKIWPHIADEISEEARLGSLKHWAYTDINPVKKPAAPTTRREAAAATLANLGDSEVAHRSEARREAILARRQRTGQHVDSDFDEARSVARKTNTNNKKRVTEQIPEAPGLGISTGGGGKRKRPEKLAVGGVGMERSISSAMGGRAMSRENSQQDGSKKRKASVAPTTVARKRYVFNSTLGPSADYCVPRLNASALDSPKLASSPLAGTVGKEAYKRSPALSSVRPALARGRQNSMQRIDTGRERQSSIASSKNGNNHNVTASTPELNSVAAVTGKTASEVKNTMKETRTDKGDRLIEDEPAAVNGANGEPTLRGALLLERSASRQSVAKGEQLEDLSTKAAPSPRLTPALQAVEYKNERIGRGRASKTSTPVVSTFAEAEESEGTSTNGNAGKPKRLARPRVKDHGLHDSLSPKGLPMKRSHKKNGSVISGFGGLTQTRPKDENEVSGSTSELTVGPGEGEEEEEEENEADDEERYCYCQGVSYGEMVACDKDDCPRQWFHLDCIGLKSVPKSAKWYCDECKEALARKSNKYGNGNGGNGSTGGNGNGNGSGSGSGNGNGK